MSKPNKKPSEAAVSAPAPTPEIEAAVPVVEAKVDPAMLRETAQAIFVRLMLANPGKTREHVAAMAFDAAEDFVREAARRGL